MTRKYTHGVNLMPYSDFQHEYILANSSRQANFKCTFWSSTTQWDILTS